MLKLIKLEMKKTKMGVYIRGALIANLVMMGILLTVIFVSKSEEELRKFAFDNYNVAFLMVDSLVKSTFIVIASVLLTRFVIEEYKNGTITLLFMYPIKRKKLIVAKLLIVSLFTFISIILSNIILDSVLLSINNFYGFIPGKLTKTILINNMMLVSMNALTSACMGLIPLYFGMKKKSVPTTIISSLLIVLLVFSNNSGYSLSSIIAIPILLASIGVFIAYLSIRNIEHIDVTK